MVNLLQMNGGAVILSSQSFMSNIYETVKNKIQALFDRGTGRLPADEMLHQRRYIIVQTIGRGGMGAVYMALDTLNQNQRVAIKEMSQARLDEKEREERTRAFQEEARLLGSLSHPHLPRVYESFEERGRSYLVMEYIEGETLLQMLQRMPGYALPVNKVLHYALQLCDVLMYLHQAQPGKPCIIFRDLKPTNVMITANDEVYLIDFGIARFFQEEHSGKTGFLGTPGFAAPEQYGNARIVPQTDLYSLGVTMHYCLTRQDPRAKAFVFDPVCQFNPQVPPELDSLIQRLVDPDVRQRPASAFEVKQELEHIQLQLSGMLVTRSSTASPSQYLPPTVPASPSGGSQAPMFLSGGVTIQNQTNNVATTVPVRVTPLPRGVSLPGVPVRRMGRWFSTTAWPYVLVQGTWLGRYLASLTWGFSTSVWTPRFIKIAVLTLAFALIGSIYLFNIFHNSWHIVALYLALIALVTTVVASTSKDIRDPVPRSILFFTGLALLVVSFALQALPDVQKLLGNWSQTVTLNQLLIGGVFLGAVVSLIRQVDRFAWVDHVTLAVLAGSCALLQYAFGMRELQQVPFLSPDSYSSTNNVLACTLLALAVISLLRFARPFSKGDQVMVLGVSVLYGVMQYSFGYAEFQHASSVMQPSIDAVRHLLFINVLFTFGPLLFALIALCSSSRWLSSLALLALAVAWAFLQNFLGGSVSISFLLPGTHPLLNTVLEVTTRYQLVVDALLMLAILLLLRLRSRYMWIDRLGVFGVAAACAAVEYAFWDGKAQRAQLVASSIDQSAINQQFVIVACQTVAYAMYGAIILALCGLLIAAAFRLFLLARPYSHIGHAMTSIDNVVERLEGVMVVGIALVSIILPLSFSNVVQTVILLPQQLSEQQWTGNSQEVTMLVLAALLLMLIIPGCIVLYRLLARKSYQFDGSGRFVVVLGASICLLLIWTDSQVQHLPALASRLQLSGNILHLQVGILNLLLATGLIAAGILSLFWLKRLSLAEDRNVLLVLFSVVVCCALLQVFGQAFLILALFLLIAGILVAAQMERVS
jgi:serine/threonine protein kinase